MSFGSEIIILFLVLSEKLPTGNKAGEEASLHTPWTWRMRTVNAVGLVSHTSDLSAEKEHPSLGCVCMCLTMFCLIVFQKHGKFQAHIQLEIIV